MRVGHVLIGISIILFIDHSIYGQSILKPIAASYASLNAYNIHHADVFSFVASPASLAQVKQRSAGIYGERKFLLAELSNYIAVAALPTASGNFGLKAGYAGFEAFNETQLGLAYGRKLGSKVDVGIQFSYNSIRMQGYGNAGAIGMDAGAMFHLSEKLHTGFCINNPIGTKFSKLPGEELPFIYTAGFGYETSEQFFFGLEIKKEKNLPVTVNAGAQYRVIQLLWARAGISSATSAVWLGIGLALQKFRIDITSSYHPQLGITPGLMLVFPSPSSREQED